MGSDESYEYDESDYDSDSTREYCDGCGYALYGGCECNYGSIQRSLNGLDE